ncbi:MAG: hypothetical protein J0M11_13540 [Anaerolineae bacterium]|nr:hypothetical protein [Anaerolineae bacterium]
MKKAIILPSKNFYTGCILGIIFGCIVGTVIGASGNSSNKAMQNVITATKSKAQATPSNTPELNTPSPTTTPIFSPTATNTPIPYFLETPLTNCGENLLYNAKAEVIKIPIIENDQIIENASYVKMTYTIRNAYENTPIYGFEIHPSPGYETSERYPNTLFNSNSPFQPNEEAVLTSQHLFLPENWKIEDHPNSFMKFPENMFFRPYPNIGGHTINFQIIEIPDSLSNNKEIKCDGAVTIQ